MNRHEKIADSYAQTTTLKERAVLVAALDNAYDVTRYDFGFVDEVESYCDLNAHQVAGTLGHLQAKGFLYLHDPETIDGETSQQITFADHVLEQCYAAEKAEEGGCAEPVEDVDHEAVERLNAEKAAPAADPVYPALYALVERLATMRDRAAGIVERAEEEFAQAAAAGQAARFLDGSERLFQAAARVEVARRCLRIAGETDAGQAFQAVEETALDEVRHAALTPKQSTSPTANLAAQYRLAAWSEVVEVVDRARRAEA